MKHLSSPIFLYSLTALTICVSNLAYAEEELMTVPELEGGISASIGTIYLNPSSDYESYFTVLHQPDGPGGSTQVEVLNVTPDYEFGIDAALGYIFTDTANDIELSYRYLNTSDSSFDTFTDASDGNGGTIEGNTTGYLDYNLNAVDLMMGQFMNVGQHMQMRFNAGLSYVELKQERETILNATGSTPNTGELSSQTSKFSGIGPRVGIDSRYDFGQGIGILAGGSMAYYLGELDLDVYFNPDSQSDPDSRNSYEDQLDDHAVMNFRANLALDYVYFFNDEERSTLGLELGYLIDYYADGIGASNIASGVMPVIFGEPAYTTAISFSGPYLNLKGIY
ncbi:MAG: Lpg1974 family pore-forming outer membrane protein [Legionellales bacterium]|jgi:hypothetical protein